MNWFKKVEARGRYEINCDQDDGMTGPTSLNSSYADSLRGAQAIANHKTRLYSGLTFRIDDRQTGETVGRGRR